MDDDKDNMMTLKDLLTTKEAAEILGTTSRTLSRWRKLSICGIPLFSADEKRGNKFFYCRERVEQLKSVYHKFRVSNIAQSSSHKQHINREPEQLSEQNSILIQLNNFLEESDRAKKRKQEAASKMDQRQIYLRQQVANILGVTEITIIKWRCQSLFFEDAITSDGEYLYSEQTIERMKRYLSQHPADLKPKPEPNSLLEFVRSKLKEKRIDVYCEKTKDTMESLNKNVQIHPSATLLIPNDVFSKFLFNLSVEEYQEAIDKGVVLRVIEKRKFRGGKDITTPFRISVDDNFEPNLRRPLNQFDFAVLCACISEWSVGNRYTTLSIIYRAISGKVGKSDFNPGREQIMNILQSLDKLRRTRIGINMDTVCKKLHYNGGASFRKDTVLLPCKFVNKTTINGQETSTIFFEQESLLLEIARMKNNQLLSCETSLLYVANQNSTCINVSVKFYVLRRVLEIIAHSKQMTPSITFSDLYQKCRIEDLPPDKKSHVRRVILKLLEKFQGKGRFMSYQLNKRGNRVCSISLLCCDDAK